MLTAEDHEESERRRLGAVDDTFDGIGLGHWCEDIEWSEADGFLLAGTYIGPQAVVEGVFMRLGEIGDEFAAVPGQIVAEGNTVRVRELS